MDYKMKREEEGQLEAIATIWVKKGGEKQERWREVTNLAYIRKVELAGPVAILARITEG